jgi:hypothetical protein
MGLVFMFYSDLGQSFGTTFPLLLKDQMATREGGSE